IKPTSSGDTPFRTKVDVFILTPPLLQYENIINGNLVFSNTLRCLQAGQLLPSSTGINSPGRVLP
ncbi:MAG: hypothetical protein PHI97_29955, partial [Desulfobulbus sp.]|nr:hypothetical protein [Desulfobulbus sp.]